MNGAAFMVLGAIDILVALFREGIDNIWQATYYISGILLLIGGCILRRMK